VSAAFPAYHDDDFLRAAGRASAGAGNGRRAELRRPLGAIVGGLIVSQMLTLFTTPVIYLLLDRLRVRFSRARPSPCRPGIFVLGGL